jgi:phage baseplate assembly protein W
MTVYSGISTIDFTSGVVAKGKFPSTNGITKPPFNSYSGLENPGSNTLKLTDLQLVERNLLNHLYTPKNARLMMPSWGTDIQKILFEPLDELTIEKCRLEIEKVVAYDPRVKLNKLYTVPLYDLNIIAVTLNLFYIELNVTKDMNFNLEFTTT